MNEFNFSQLADYARALAAFTPEREAAWLELGGRLRSELPTVAARFFNTFERVPNALPCSEADLALLRQAQQDWLGRLFDGPLDENFVRMLFCLAELHVEAQLPVSPITAALSQVNEYLADRIAALPDVDAMRRVEIQKAVNAALCYCTVLLQEAYQSSSLIGELDRFLKVTGISRPLFRNLASVYSTH